MTATRTNLSVRSATYRIPRLDAFQAPAPTPRRASSHAQRCTAYCRKHGRTCGIDHERATPGHHGHLVRDTICTFTTGATACP